MKPLNSSLVYVVKNTSIGSYNTPLPFSAQESYVQDRGVGVEVF